MLADLDLRPLDPRYLSVMRWSAALSSAVLVAVALGAAAAIGRNGPLALAAVAPAIALVWGVWSVLIAAPRRWSRWAHAFTGTELHVASGWLTHAHTVVPVRRVQHIDLTQGVLERRYGLATLVLHTAGTVHARVALPGLAREEAERIRDEIRARVERGAA